jgi:hypothetical protein
MRNGASISTVEGLFSGGGGGWAAARFLEGAKKGELSLGALRTLDTLRKDEWIYYDDVVVEETAIRLRAVSDLIGRGLVTNIPDALATMIYQYEKISDMQPANVSMSGLVRAYNDGVDVGIAGVPLPIIHKDFRLDIRHLMASRKRGEPLDTMQTRVSTRMCAEKMESLLFSGGPTFLGFPIYGLLTHPDRNTTSFGTNGHWGQAAKTGADFFADIKSAITILQADRMYGPYGVWAPADAVVNLEKDYIANYPKSVRQRLMEFDNLAFINSSDQLPSANLVVVQLTPDVVTWGRGEDPTPVQWEIGGGFGIDFKVFALGMPIIRSDKTGRSGIVHFT